MNKYKRAVIKRLSKGINTIDQLEDIRCRAIVMECLEELENEKLVEHVTKMYCIYDSRDPSREYNEERDVIDCDQWRITLKGLDYLSTTNKDFVLKFIPIIISTCALLVSILKL